MKQPPISRRLQHEMQGAGLNSALLDMSGNGSLALAPISENRANVSPDPLAFWLAHCRCPEGPVSPRVLAEARTALDERFGPGRHSTLYTRAEYRNLAMHFAPLNAAFQKKIETIQPDFTLSPPDLLPADTLWREDVAALCADQN